MTRLAPEQLWWTADELAASGLPQMPGTKRGVNAMADRGAWRSLPDAARKKPGRGGGWQYHWSVLPVETQRVLLSRASDPETSRPDRGTAWASFERLPDTVKAKAQARLEIIKMVEAIHAAGNSHVASVSAVAKANEVSDRTLYNWLALIEGVDAQDWLAYLAPRHRLAKRAASPTTNVRPFMDHLKSAFLRLGWPTFKQCYRDAKAEAKAQGWDILTERTAKRRLDAEVPRVTRVFLREGVRGLEKCFPPQIRDKSGMTAMEGVNADCHKIDVFVSWPDGTINRPQIVAFQDLYSGKILSWRVDNDPNKVMVMAAWGELVENWGTHPRKWIVSLRWWTCCVAGCRLCNLRHTALAPIPPIDRQSVVHKTRLYIKVFRTKRRRFERIRNLWRSDRQPKCCRLGSRPNLE